MILWMSINFEMRKYASYFHECAPFSSISKNLVIQLIATIQIFTKFDFCFVFESKNFRTNLWRLSSGFPNCKPRIFFHKIRLTKIFLSFLEDSQIWYHQGEISNTYDRYGYKAQIRIYISKKNLTIISLGVIEI